MGCKSLLPTFCTATETVADLENSALQFNKPDLPHQLDDRAEVIVSEAPPILQSALEGITREPYLRRSNAKSAAYVDVFVHNFLRLAQGPAHRQLQLRKTLFHALDKVFQTCDPGDLANRKGVLLLNKIMAGDCAWSTCKVLLGWVIDKVNMMMSLPPHWENRIKDILAGIPCSQKRIGVDKWNRVLGELRSMATPLPGSRGLFSHMQESLRHV